jgi:hypothetical protein
MSRAVQLCSTQRRSPNRILCYAGILRRTVKPADGNSCNILVKLSNSAQRKACLLSPEFPAMSTTGTRRLLRATDMFHSASLLQTPGGFHGVTLMENKCRRLLQLAPHTREVTSAIITTRETQVSALLMLLSGSAAHRWAQFACNGTSAVLEPARRFSDT